MEKTPISGDFGADLVARTGREVVVVQCKDYGLPAGIKAVQEVHFARAHYRASDAAVVARNGFTRAAIQAAATSNVHLFRPTDLARGNPFDRTLQRKEAERRQWAEELAQENDYKFEIWREYDAAMILYNLNLGNKFYWNIAIYINIILWIVFIIFSVREKINYIYVVGLTCLQLGVLFRLCLNAHPSPPSKPGFDRRSSIIKCSNCRQQLRIDFGKEGWVRCPKCKNLTPVSVHTVSTSRKRDNVDASFFG